MASYFRFLFSLIVPVDSFLSSFISHSPSKVCIYNCYKKNSTERWNCISQSILSLSISVLGKSEVKRSRNKAQEKIHQTFWYVTGIIKIPLLAWWKKSSNLKSSHASIVPDCSIDNVTIWCIGNVRQPTKSETSTKIGRHDVTLFSISILLPQTPGHGRAGMWRGILLTAGARLVQTGFI